MSDEFFIFQQDMPRSTKRVRQSSFLPVTLPNVQLECGPMPNVMVALPNIGGALCSTPQSLADAHNYMPCSNAAKTRRPMKVAGVPQTP